MNQMMGLSALAARAEAAVSSIMVARIRETIFFIEIHPTSFISTGFPPLMCNARSRLIEITLPFRGSRSRAIHFTQSLLCTKCTMMITNQPVVIFAFLGGILSFFYFVSGAGFHGSSQRKPLSVAGSCAPYLHIVFDLSCSFMPFPQVPSIPGPVIIVNAGAHGSR